MQRWRILAAATCVALLLLEQSVVCAAENEDEEFLHESERMQRELYSDVNPDEPPPPEASSVDASDPPPPQPSPTPDPNIPPGLEEIELIAFRLEYAEEKAMNSLMEWAYNWVVKDRGYKDELLRAKDLPDFLHRTLNPAEEDIDDEERAMLNEATAFLREEQGLHDDFMPLYIGFLSRGSPMRYVRELAHKMHVQRRVRRLQAAPESDRDL